MFLERGNIMFPSYYLFVSPALGAFAGYVLGRIIGSVAYESSSIAGQGFGPTIKGIAGLTAAVSGGIIAGFTTAILWVSCR